MLLNYSAKPLKRSFFLRDTVQVAKDLLGKYLVRQLDGAFLAGKITEVEAYLGFNDEAAHSYKGKTTRTAVIFGDAGYTYVYHIHRYHCMDIVTEGPDIPGSVLIRSIAPLAGVEIMKRLRGKETDTGLTNGPGKLCQALAVTRSDNGIDVTAEHSLIRILPGDIPAKVVATPRIGIAKATDKLLRFVSV